ncbi:unnamed protein product, partial [Coregonus sp. 'balchen']
MAVAARCCYSITQNVPFTFYLVIFLLSGLTNAQIRYTIPEELENGAVVGDIVRDLGLDLRKLSSRRIRITSDSARRYFNINHKNGKLSVSDRIDRETLCEFSGTCFLNLEVVVENPLEVHNVEVEILDANDNSPQFPRDEYQLEISESAVTGSRFPIEGAQDPDDGSNSVRLYRLSNNDHLALDSNKPVANSKHIELVLKKPFDREHTPSHQFILTAVDGGTPARTGTAKINVHVLDSNDNVPAFDNSVYKVKLLENSPKGALVIKLNATDPDEGTNGEVFYSFSSYTPERIRTMRRVSEDNSTSFLLTVLVRDHGLPPLSSTATINVHVMELPPKLTPDPKRIIRPHSPLLFSNVTLYLIVALSATTFVFLVTIVVLAIVRCHAYCTQPGSCSPCCVSQKRIPEGGTSAGGGGGSLSRGGGGGGGGGQGQPNNNVALRRDLKVEPHYIEVRGNGSMTKTYCYKTCMTATSGSDTFMFYNTGRPHSGTWGSGGYVTSQSGQSQMFVRRLSMPDATAIQ